MGRQLPPNRRRMKIRPGICREKQHPKSHRREISRINAPKSSDPKTSPVFSLLLKAQVYAKPADDEKNGHADLPETKREKTEKRNRDGKAPNPAMPGQVYVTKSGTESM